MSGIAFWLLVIAFVIACCVWEGFLLLVILGVCLYNWPVPTFIVSSVVIGLLLLYGIGDVLFKIHSLLQNISTKFESKTTEDKGDGS